MPPTVIILKHIGRKF